MSKNNINFNNFLAIRHCIDNECDGCPYDNTHDCQENMLLDAYDLILSLSPELAKIGKIESIEEFEKQIELLCNN